MKRCLLGLGLLVLVGCAVTPKPETEIITNLDGDGIEDTVRVSPRGFLGNYMYDLNITWTEENFSKNNYILASFDDGDSKFWIKDYNNDGNPDLLILEKIRPKRWYELIGSDRRLSLRRGIPFGTFKDNSEEIKIFDGDPTDLEVKNAIEEYLR